jgi:hypothetical protein
VSVILNQDGSTNNANPGTGTPNTNLGGGAPAPAGGITPVVTGSSAPVQAGSSGSGFTNLKSYLDANKGAGQNIANAISQKGTNQENQVSQGISQANNTIGNQMAQENANIAAATTSPITPASPTSVGASAPAPVAAPTPATASVGSSNPSATSIPSSGVNKSASTIPGTVPTVNPSIESVETPTDISSSATASSAPAPTPAAAPAPTPTQGGFVGQLLAGNAAGITGNANSLNQFQQLYGGTNNSAAIQNAATQAFAPVQQNLANAQTFAGQTGSENGRFNLLQQTLGGQNYTPGAQSIDQMLIQNGAGNNTLNQLQQNLANRANINQANLAAAQNNVTSGIAGINAGSAAAQQALQGAVGTANTNLSNTIGTQGKYTAAANGNPASLTGGSGEVLAAQQAALANNTTLQNALSSGQGLTAAQWQSLGLSAGDASTMNTLYGLSTPDSAASVAGQHVGTQMTGNDVAPVNLSTFLGGMKGANPNLINAGNVATTGDYNQYNALSQLSGQTPSYLASGNIANAGTAATAGAGTYNTADTETALAQALAASGQQFGLSAFQPGAMGTQTDLSAILNPTNAAQASQIANLDAFTNLQQARAAAAGLNTGNTLTAADYALLNTGQNFNAQIGNQGWEASGGLTKYYNPTGYDNNFSGSLSAAGNALDPATRAALLSYWNTGMAGESAPTFG